MKSPIAAIDIGTYTARLLIAHFPDGSGPLRALARKRNYIHLGEYFDKQKKIIPSHAIERTIAVLKSFLQEAAYFKAESIHAVATGVVREAINREEFLHRILEQTGIFVICVTGEKEAQLTTQGVLNGLGNPSGPIVVFDLGGGSTEFYIKDSAIQIIRSIPLGAVILTKEHLTSDPPEQHQIHSLSQTIDKCLNGSDLEFGQDIKKFMVIGTGGTVTTLALMQEKIPPEDGSGQQVNGLVLERQQIEVLFEKMKTLKLEQRLRLRGLDRERGRIIPAGCLAVIRILYFLKAHSLMVSLSDLLEGILFNQFEGNNYE